MPPSYIHSSVALLSLIYLTHTGIAPMLVLTLLFDFYQTSLQTISKLFLQRLDTLHEQQLLFLPGV